MQTCSACKGLEGSLPLSQGTPLDTLSAAAAGGCPICHVLCRAVRAVDAGEEAARGELRVGWDKDRIQGLRIVVGRHDTGKFLLGIDLFHPQGLVSCRQSHWGERPTEISGDTSSDAARTAIRHWLQTCESSHGCRPDRPVPLPARVLDVRRLDHIYLYCSEPGEEGAYACLSHCWGRERTLQTTLANFSQHRDEIAWDDLPQTFRDAASVVSALGIPYLWIDSLCIVQDSKEDWQDQSARMASVYANGVLTIAASLANADSKGLFSTSHASHSSQIIDVQASRGEVPAYDTLHVRRTLAHGHGAEPLPLMRRAWVLQERLLSPRVAHFLPGEVAWECMETTLCECGCVRALWSPQHEPFVKDLLHGTVLSRLPRTEVRTRWHQLVGEYSRLELTFDADRLPAVSGAARRFASVLGRGGYVAGMWRDGLLRDLIWERRGAMGEVRRLEHIPTWSWASVMGAQVVVEEAMATHDLAVVLDARCSPVPGADEFGEISGGELVLSGVLSHISLSSCPHDGANGEMNLSVVTDAGESATCPGLLTYVADTGDIPHPDVGLVAVQLATRKGVYSSERDEEIWMVLRPSEENIERYQRVGLLKMEPGTMPLGEAGETSTVTIV